MLLFGKKKNKFTSTKKTRKKRKKHLIYKEHNFDKDLTDNEFFEIIDDWYLYWIDFELFY